jgi:acyl-CoA dehydrogenase
MHAAPAFRSAFGTNVAIGSQGILIDGTEEQKKAYLPRLASGEMISSFALTEPDIGSDAASVKTRAARDGNGYVLNGTKRFITNAPVADLFTVMARTNPDERGAKGVSAFLVEADTPGIRLGKPENKMGQKGAHICDVIFEDCRVPADAIIGGVEGQGFKTAMKVLDKGRLHIGACCCGLADRLIQESLDYAIDRQQFGQAIAEFQLVQAMLADSQTEHDVGWALVRDAAGRYEAGEKLPRVAAEAKYYCSEMLGRVADRAVQIHGGAGYINDTAVSRLYRDVRIYRLYEGTSQIQQLVIARDMIRRAREARS